MTQSPSPPQPEGAWLRTGRTLYLLNAQGVNRFYLQIQPGKDDQDRRVTDEECEAVAVQIHEALNHPAALREAREALELMSKALEIWSGGKCPLDIWKVTNAAKEAGARTLQSLTPPAE